MGSNQIDSLLGEAVEHHRQGRLAIALQFYDAVIGLDPDFAPAYCNRALVLHSLNRFDDALQNYDRAVMLEPNYADAYYNRGITLRSLNRLEEAVRSYDRAIALRPDFAEAYNNRGNALRELNQPERALESFGKAIELLPRFAHAHLNRGNALRDVKDLKLALESFNAAIALRPDFAEAHHSRGNVLQDLGRSAEAIESYDRAIALRPHFVEAYCARGNALMGLARPGQALISCDRAIALNASYADAHNTRGNALLGLNRSNEALESYNKTIELNPFHAEAYGNRGHRLRDLKRVDEAVANFDRAIALKPDFVEAYWDKGLCKLLMGNYEEGLPLYEWRKKRADRAGFRTYLQPVWSGKEALKGKTLLVYAEQGFGDTIQFCRYAPLAEEKGAKVILAVQDGLIRLLRSLSSAITFERLTDSPLAFDYHVALSSMPLAFQTTLSTCPTNIPYLRAEPEKVGQWKSRLGQHGLKIGICWQGSKTDSGRSFPVHHFEALSRLPGVRLISLQKNDSVEQRFDLPAGIQVETLGKDFDCGPDAFVDTAAVMECLDLVITPDTAMAHLAGALGRPAWVALKYVPDWRWLLDRSDSPWYPTLRLFRQPKPDDWTSVFAAMQAQLADRLSVEAIELRPDHAEAHFKRGNALRDLQRLEEALESFNRAIELKPDCAEAYNDRAGVLHSLKQSAKALESYSRAIELRPDFADAYMNMASMMQDLKRPDLALEICDRLIEIKPDCAEARNSRGDALKSLKRLDEALQSYDRAIDSNSGFAKAYNNRGIALQQLGRVKEALESYDAAIALKADYAKAYNNRGGALQELKRWEEARESYDRAIALKPDFVEAHFSKSGCTLRQGNFEEGWPLYEWRKKLDEPRGLLVCSQPAWTGIENLDGRTLFIHAEQGLGDTIQFCRYALLAQERGAKVILAVQEPLVRLMKSLSPAIAVDRLTTTPAGFDYHIALMSMPLAFQTTLSTCPAKMPYLRAEPGRVATWKDRLGSDGFRIGICWQGNKQVEIDKGRSVAVRHFEALAGLPNVRLISLQKNDGIEQLRDLPSGMDVETLGEEFDAGPDAFVDTAAVMECLDLVITSDTAIAHLAGALGRPARVALQYVPEWRWLMDRSDSPWYPTLTLFRQPRPDDWPSVFAAIQAQLAARTE